VEVIEGPGSYRVNAAQPLRAIEVQTLAYPGFPTDLQAAFTALLTTANGSSVVHERVYDDRLQYVGELRKMGADIRVFGQTARIEGPRRLRGAQVRATDIRAGAALIIAGLAAEGRTEIGDIHHVNRGYEGLEAKLNGLGAQVTRIEEEIQEAVI
jgi:UDP-N-acetylglucosamine 1-carboxyvinyltransferase